MTAEAWADLGPRPEFAFQWRLGNALLAAHDPWWLLHRARLPMLIIAVLLGAVMWAWGRQLLGPGAALGALVLFALDPALIAHGPLVTTDIGFATTAVLFVFLLWRYVQDRTPERLVLAGGALGLALAVKYSAVFLVPIAALLLLLATPLAPGRRLLWCVGTLVALQALAVVVVEAAYFFPRTPWLYVDGFRSVYLGIDPAYRTFFAGEFGLHFWSYQLVAYLLKEPLASIALLGVGLYAISRPGLTAVDRAFLLLPPALLGVAYTVFAANMGVRYVIPLLPFLHLVGGAGLALLWKAGRGPRALAVLLVGWLALAAAGIYPDHLSYFNEAACVPVDVRMIGVDGGTRCGVRWLDDSNVDWGQGLGQLAAWLAAHPSGQPVRLAYFGSASPERFGVKAEPFDARVLAQAPPPGRYVLSAHIFARLRAALAARGSGGEGWLLRARPTAIVGHAYYVYDVVGGPTWPPQGSGHPGGAVAPLDSR
jgi:dolichyl-phosphate-mannose-protein mannosyltransferase